MFSKCILIVFGLFAVAHQAMAIKCYACAGSKTSDCAKGKTSSMVTRACQDGSMGSNPIFFDMDISNETNVQSVCISLTMSGYQPDLVQRGCASIPSNADPCTYLKPFPQIKACKSCNTDLCNGQAN